MFRWIWLVGLGVLVACSPAQETKVAVASQELTQACDLAMTLSPLAGPVAPWIVAGCGTAEAVAKLAADPSSAVWVNGLIAKVQAL